MRSATVRALAALCIFGILPAAPALAQSWPTKPIRLIVPFPAGGGTDVVARTIANGITEGLGQAIVVENRGGAGGTLGADIVAKAAPDGYTIGIATSSTHPAAVVLQKDVPYDPVKSFAPITLIGTTPYILVASPEFPAKTLAEFVAHAKANPGKINFASVGATTLGYLLTEQFKLLAGIDMLHVPYRGAAQAYPDVMANRVSVFLDNPTGSAGLVKDGRLRGYAVTQKSAVLPEVPTFAEAGVPGFDAVFWYGYVAPAGTPPAIIERIQREVSKFVNSPHGKADLASKDISPVASTPDAFAKTIATDVTNFKTLADKVGVKPE
jgi:tripartite-type tricarboxylate transporter receptor subunit TctC